MADGKEVEVVGIGSGIIKQKGNKNAITLKNVLQASEICENLISVKKITEKECNVQFDEKRCNIIKNNQVVATCRMHRKLV